MTSSAVAVLWSDEAGQYMVEYSFLLAFIALAAIGLLGGRKGQSQHHQDRHQQESEHCRVLAART